MTAPSPRVRVAEGELLGSTADGVHSFLGVPFAAPPVADRRFRLPVPAEPWEGIREATADGSPSFQIDASNRARVGARIAELDPGLGGIAPFPPVFIDDVVLDSSSEDCLYLDIYVPQNDVPQNDVPENATADAPLPVFVYFHGGANVTNNASGRFDYQRGDRLARAENVIVVQPQYRLGALGWVHFGLVDPELGEAVNLGFQDQIAALRWVSENIAAFGGDPANITIGGESAGATAVSQLIANPVVRRYARRAILQSLSPYNTWCTQEPAEARAVAETYRAVLGRDAIARADPVEFLAMQSLMLRLFPPDEVVAWRPHGAVVDGDLIEELPAVRLAERPGIEQPFEVVLGFAKDEWQFFRGHAPTFRDSDAVAAVKIVERIFGGAGAEAILHDYRRLHPGRSTSHLVSDVMSFAFFKLAALEMAQQLTAQGIDVYVFEFAYDHPGLGGYLRALHTGVQPFLWRSTTPDRRRAFRSLDGVEGDDLDRVAAEFGAHYGAFIRSGRPGATWLPFGDEESVLWLGATIESRSGLLTGERAAFTAAGIGGVRILEERLLARLRAKLPEALARISGAESV